MKRKEIECWRVALGICALGFLFCGGKAMDSVLQARREAQANDLLSRQVREFSAERIYAPSGILAKYDALYQQNEELGGWLSIPDTTIDYPVMYTPDNPEKYLRLAFDGSYAISGSLFIGEGCSPDSSNVVIYGHNMKNGTMFGGLLPYTKEDFARAHPVIRLDTLTQEREYQVIAAFYCAQEEGESFPYQDIDLTDEEAFGDYLTKVKKRTLWQPNAWPEFGTRLVTLSTCSYQGEAGRFVVVAAERRNTAP